MGTKSFLKSFHTFIVSNQRDNHQTFINHMRVMVVDNPVHLGVHFYEHNKKIKLAEFNVPVLSCLH